MQTSERDRLLDEGKKRLERFRAKKGKQHVPPSDNNSSVPVARQDHVDEMANGPLPGKVATSHSVETAESAAQLPRSSLTPVNREAPAVVASHDDVAQQQLPAKRSLFLLEEDRKGECHDDVSKLGPDTSSHGPEHRIHTPITEWMSARETRMRCAMAVALEMEHAVANLAYAGSSSVVTQDLVRATHEVVLLLESSGVRPSADIQPDSMQWAPACQALSNLQALHANASPANRQTHVNGHSDEQRQQEQAHTHHGHTQRDYAHTSTPQHVDAHVQHSSVRASGGERGFGALALTLLDSPTKGALATNLADSMWASPWESSPSGVPTPVGTHANVGEGGNVGAHTNGVGGSVRPQWGHGEGDATAHAHVHTTPAQDQLTASQLRAAAGQSARDSAQSSRRGQSGGAAAAQEAADMVSQLMWENSSLLRRVEVQANALIEMSVEKERWIAEKAAVDRKQREADMKVRIMAEEKQQLTSSLQSVIEGLMSENSRLQRDQPQEHHTPPDARISHIPIPASPSSTAHASSVQTSSANTSSEYIPSGRTLSEHSSSANTSSIHATSANTSSIHATSARHVSSTHAHDDVTHIDGSYKLNHTSSVSASTQDGDPYQETQHIDKTRAGLEHATDPHKRTDSVAAVGVTVGGEGGEDVDSADIHETSKVDVHAMASAADTPPAHNSRAESRAETPPSTCARDDDVALVHGEHGNYLSASAARESHVSSLHERYAASQEGREHDYVHVDAGTVHSGASNTQSGGFNTHSGSGDSAWSAGMMQVNHSDSDIHAGDARPNARGVIPIEGMHAHLENVHQGDVCITGGGEGGAIHAGGEVQSVTDASHSKSGPPHEASAAQHTDETTASKHKQHVPHTSIPGGSTINKMPQNGGGGGREAPPPRPFPPEVLAHPGDKELQITLRHLDHPPRGTTPVVLTLLDTLWGVVSLRSVRSIFGGGAARPAGEEDGLDLDEQGFPKSPW